MNDRYAGQLDSVEHFDVLIVGAGISGIGSAYHLNKECPGTRFVVLDALDSFGGTWRLVAQFVCRLLRHMMAKGVRQVTPMLREQEQDMPRLPWIDPENFNPGYLMRSMHLLPRRGGRPQWQHTQDYWTEKDVIPAIDLEDGALLYD